MDGMKTGLDKLFDMVGLPTEDAPAPKVNKVSAEENSDLPQDTALIPTASSTEEDFSAMVDHFRAFINTHPHVVGLNLKMVSLTNGEWLVYQGSMVNSWVYLRRKQCHFIRLYLLETIKRLPEDSYLQKYFKAYSVVQRNGGM